MEISKKITLLNQIKPGHWKHLKTQIRHTSICFCFFTIYSVSRNYVGCYTFFFLFKFVFPSLHIHHISICYCSFTVYNISMKYAGFICFWFFKVVSHLFRFTIYQYVFALLPSTAFQGIMLVAICFLKSCFRFLHIHHISIRFCSFTVYSISMNYAGIICFVFFTCLPSLQIHHILICFCSFTVYSVSRNYAGNYMFKKKVVSLFLYILSKWRIWCKSTGVAWVLAAGSPQLGRRFSFISFLVLSLCMYIHITCFCCDILPKIFSYVVLVSPIIDNTGWYLKICGIDPLLPYIQNYNTNYFPKIQFCFVAIGSEIEQQTWTHCTIRSPLL